MAWRSELRSRLSAGLVAALAAALAWPVTPAVAATIAYPDLQIRVPTSDLAIAQSGGARVLTFSHVIWNAGAGPLEIRPAYDPSTGVAQATQALYATDGTVAATRPIVTPMPYAPPDKYRFPLALFALYAVAPGGGLGRPEATSPKLDYCMTPDTFIGGVPGTPSQSHYPTTNCDSPSGLLGLDVGWGDRYDAMDAGEDIDLTNVPDGTHWLRAIVDPYHELAESNVANDITDTQVTISGTSVAAAGQQAHPDSTPPAVAVTAPAAGATVSGQVTLAAAASGPAPIASVQFLLDGQPLGAPVTSPPYAMTWSSAGSAGQHLLSARALDTNGRYDTAAAVPVTVALAVGGFTVGALSEAAGTGRVSAPPVSTSTGGDLLLALIGSDGPPGGGLAMTVSGGGLTWQLVRRSSGQPGDAEVWQATAPGPLSGATVTAMPSTPGYDQLLTVVAIAGASGVGASAAAGGRGAPSSQLTSTAAGSWIVGAGDDWDAATPRTVAGGQQVLSQLVDRRTGDTFWSQASTTTSSTAGQTLTLADTAPAGDRWNLAAVEVLPGGAPPPPDTRPPAAGIVNPTPGETVSGTVPVAVSATDDTPITSVQLLLDGQPLGAPLTSSPYGAPWDTTRVANGSHVLGATATDAAGNVGHAPNVTVTVANPAPPDICFTVDAQTSVDGTGAVTTPAFRTAQPGELLLAFAASDGPASAAQTLTVSGAGLGWVLVRRANTQAGTAEVWAAGAPPVLTSATVTSTQALPGYDQSLTVVALQGAAGIGAIASAGGRSGAPAVVVTTTHGGSMVYAVGNDWDAAIPRTVDPNQLLVHQWVDRRTGDTYWAQSTTLITGAAGSVVTMGGSAPTGDRWNLAAIEVVAGPD